MELGEEAEFRHESTALGQMTPTEDSSLFGGSEILFMRENDDVSLLLFQQNLKLTMFSISCVI